MTGFSTGIVELSASAMIVCVRMDPNESAAPHFGFGHPRIPFILDNSLYYQEVSINN
jgi:hypothetical protein